MSKVNKSLLIVFVFLFVAFSCFAFLLPASTASAMTSSTTFTTTTYLAQQFFYDSSLVEGNNLLVTWYFTFEVDSNNLGFYLYTVDHNYNDNPTKVELVGRPYNDTSTSVDYYQTRYGSGHRFQDYLIEFELYSSIISDISPSYLTISYSSVLNTNYDWTVKRIYDSSTSSRGGYVVAHYTWGNDSYRFTYSFVVRSTNELAIGLDNGTTPIPVNTMYFSSTLTESDQYINGYTAGLNAGQNKADNSVNIESESYKAGYTAGYNEGQDSSLNWTFILDSASDILNYKIFGVFSIMNIIEVVMAVSLVCIFLKMFAGG